jgi:type III secretory pathway component EscS
MDVSSLEHVVIRATLGDIIGFQIMQIAEQKASFQLKILALAIEIVPTYRDLERYTGGLETYTVGIL